MTEKTIKKWEKIIEDYEESGLKIKDYCDKTGINQNSLRHRIQEIRSIPNQISEVVVIDESHNPKSVNIKINGIDLQFDPSLDASVLKTIIKTCGKI